MADHRRPWSETHRDDLPPGHPDLPEGYSCSPRGEGYMQRFRSCHRDVSLPGMHSLRKIERDRFFSKIAQSTLRYEGTVGDLWSYLDGFDKRVVETVQVAPKVTDSALVAQ